MAVTRPVDSCELTDATLTAAKKAIRVSVPGVIKSFDPDSVTCDVEISVFGLQLNLSRVKTPLTAWTAITSFIR
jgi:hypothetical protein